MAPETLAHPALLVLLAVVSAWRPRWALTALLSVLPFFLQHPSSRAALWLAVLVGTFQLGYAVRVRPSPSGIWRVVVCRPALLSAVLFGVAAVLSLTSLPVADMWSEHVAASQGRQVPSWSRRVVEWISLTEARPEYSVTSALLTLQGVALALIVWREVVMSASGALSFSLAIAAGTTVFVALGLAEAFGGVSLEPLRAGGTFELRLGALQSSAGNAGWFSQYVVYALPFALAILSTRKAGGWRLAVLGGVLALTAGALVLAFQRGGWLFGAMTILYVIVAAWQVLARTSHRVPSGRTIAAAAAGVAGVTMVGAWMWTSSADRSGRLFDTSAYAARFKSIADADRLVYAQAGQKIASLHPVLGGGHESFSYRYAEYFLSPGGAFQKDPVRVPDPASAHSLYVQAWTGTGTVGLALILAMFTSAMVGIVRALRSLPDDAQRLALLAGGGSLLAMAGYGLVQEVFYVHALRLLFFVALGIVAGASGRVKEPRLRGAWLGLAGAVVLALHLGYEYYWPGPSRLLRSAEPTGVFGEERNPQGVEFRWIAGWATWPVPPAAARYSLRVRSVAPFDQHVEVRPCRGERSGITLSGQAWRAVEGDLGQCAPGERLILHITPAWRPSPQAPALGVMVSALEWH